LFSGRITAGEKNEKSHSHSRLNPFVFRAYYCAFRAMQTVWDNLSQSLCFQGVLLRQKHAAKVSAQAGLNPFVFRAYYCGNGLTKPHAREPSQSLCFQGVLLR